MTAPAINESAYTATAAMARNARTVRAMSSLLRPAWPEGDVALDAFSCVVSVVCADIQNHPFVGNDRSALLFPMCGWPQYLFYEVSENLNGIRNQKKSDEEVPLQSYPTMKKNTNLWRSVGLH